MIAELLVQLLLGPVAPSWFSSELDQVGRRELVHDDCALHHYYLNSISLELQFKPEPAISSDQVNPPKKTMADRTNTDMLILEFLSVTKPSRRRELKERLDALTKYDDSEFCARFRLSKLTVHHLLSEVCHTVHLPSFCNIIRSVYGENIQKFTTSKYHYTYE